MSNGADESKLIEAADRLITPLVKADRARRWQVRILSTVCAVLLIVVAFGGWNINRTNNLAHTVQANSSSLRAQSIENCENNDKFRAAQIKTWEKNYALQASTSKATASLLTELIATLAGNDPTRIAEIDSILKQSGKATANEIMTFLDFVKSVDAPKNCKALYAPPPK